MVRTILGLYLLVKGYFESKKQGLSMRPEEGIGADGSDHFFLDT